jgi:predicted DNA-binding protein YlxM (UPF0122 family)
MSPNELEQQTAEIAEETQTVADDILVEVKECQKELKEQTAAFQRLQETGATREQLQEALTLLQNTRQEMTELMREMREAMRQPPAEAPVNQPAVSGSPDSEQSTPSTPAPLETINPASDGAGVQERQTPKRKRRIL